MKIVIDIPEMAYEAYKEWDKSGVASVEQTIIANGTPIETVANAEEAEDYPINQEENRKIVCDFLRAITGIDVRNLIKESENE